MKEPLATFRLYRMFKEIGDVPIELKVGKIKEVV